MSAMCQHTGERLGCHVLVLGALFVLQGCAHPQTSKSAEGPSPAGLAATVTASQADLTLSPISLKEAQDTFARAPSLTAAALWGTGEAPPYTPFRMVSGLEDHPALGLVYSQARWLSIQRLGGESASLETADYARKALGLVRMRWELASTDKAKERLGREVRFWALRVECHGWQLAWDMYRAAGQVDATKGRAWAATQEALLREPDIAVQSLAPPTPSYHPLVEALRSYEANAAKGEMGVDDEWSGLVPGIQDYRVSSLRERLKREGLKVPATGNDSRWGESITAGLRAFQKRHSLVESGRVDAETLAAMRVPLARRVKQLRSILEHMRSAPYYRLPSRIVVNIPGFSLEHFEAGRMAARYRVVVGAIKRAKDGGIARGGRINATPIMSGAIDRIVLNPSWHVPVRIKEQELDVLASRNPGFYDTYRLWVDESGRERAVQPPGPHSALGKVKLGFPNNQGIFLHDTPYKDLFRESVRAYSHGCIRVEDATSLAKSILDRDPGTLSGEKADALLETYFETPIGLSQTLPVFIEYVTAGIDEAGVFRFYPDVYELGDVRAAPMLSGHPAD
jgi:hypothetical protein